MEKYIQKMCRIPHDQNHWCEVNIYLPCSEYWSKQL